MSVVQHGYDAASLGHVTLTNPVGSGNAVVAFAFGPLPSTVTLTDDKGNTYSVVDTEPDTPNGVFGKSFLLGNITNGPKTFSPSASVLLFIVEVTAAALSNPVDGHSPNLQTSVGTGAGAITSGSFAPTTAAAVVGATFNTLTAAQATPFTGFTPEDSDNTNISYDEFEILGSAGTTAVQFTAGAAGGTWITLGVGIKPASGGTQTLTPSLFTDGDTFFAPTISRGAVALTPSLYTDPDTFFAPTVTRGAVTLTPSLFTDADSFFAPTVTQGPITLSPALYIDPDTFFSATVTTGPVGLAPSLFIDPDTFFAPSVVVTYSLAPGLFTDADMFFAPTVSRGAVTLTPGLFTDADAFFSPTVSGSGPSTVTLLPDLYTDPDTFFAPIVTVATGTAFDCSFDFDAFDNDTACDTRNVFGVSFIGGIGHYKWELEEAKRLAAITTRGSPGFVDLRSPIRFDPIGGQPIAPTMPGPDPGMIAQQQASAQMQAAQAAKKRRREIEAILLLAA